MPTRKSEFKVFANVSYTHRRKPNVHVALPNRIKNVLQSVHDEKDWAKLEAVRQAIAREIEGERDFCFDRREIESIAARIEACTSKSFYDELAGCGCEDTCSCLPEGARVLVEPANLRGKIPALRPRAAAAVRELTADHSSVRVLLRGYRTQRSPPLDDMGRRILDEDLTAKDIAEGWQPKALSQGELLDRFLLTLWDALFLRQSEEWTRKKVSNVGARDTIDLASWWLRGQNVGKHPLCDHLCAMCLRDVSNRQDLQLPHAELRRTC